MQKNTKANPVFNKRFNPVITRIKLNPEQSVLSCACYATNLRYYQGAHSYMGSTSLRAGGPHDQRGCIGKTIVNRSLIGTPGTWYSAGASTMS
jgi:hypothetical protein